MELIQAHSQCSLRSLAYQVFFNAEVSVNGPLGDIPFWMDA